MVDTAVLQDRAAVQQGLQGKEDRAAYRGKHTAEVQAARVMEIRATEDNLRVRIMEAVQRAFRVKAGPM
jgi:hypothetical protein